MLGVNINIEDTIAEFQLSEQEVLDFSNYILDRIVDEFMQKWENSVNTSLRSSRDEYKRAMYTDRPDDKTAIIGLSARESKLAIMLETGAPIFDEKEGFARSEKRKMKKDGGWYLTIPFRHAVTEAIMSSYVPGTSQTAIDFMKQGGTLTPKTLPSAFQEIKTHELIMNNGSILSYKHKAPINAGMKRFDISSTTREKRGGYMTFRRVSDKSEDESWMHPGFEPRDLMEKAMSEVQIPQLIDNVTQEFLDLKFA